MIYTSAEICVVFDVLLEICAIILGFYRIIVRIFWDISWKIDENDEICAIFDENVGFLI